jgi:hypothetical protein
MIRVPWLLLKGKNILDQQDIPVYLSIDFCFSIVNPSELIFQRLKRVEDHKSVDSDPFRFLLSFR